MTHDTSGGGWREFWLALDRWLNTWFGGRGTETISSRAGRALHGHWWATALCRFLSLFERDHCQKAAHGVATPPERKPPPLDLKTWQQLKHLAAKKAGRSPRSPP